MVKRTHPLWHLDLDFKRLNEEHLILAGCWLWHFGVWLIFEATGDWLSISKETTTKSGIIRVSWAHNLPYCRCRECCEIDIPIRRKLGSYSSSLCVFSASPCLGLLVRSIASGDWQREGLCFFCAFCPQRARPGQQTTPADNTSPAPHKSHLGIVHSTCSIRPDFSRAICRSWSFPKGKGKQSRSIKQQGQQGELADGRKMTYIKYFDIFCYLSSRFLL